MEGQLKNGTILTSESGNKYTVVNLLGAGGQGEVYDVECDGKHYALKWYFKGSATARQKKLLEEIIAKGAPDSSFLWPMELIVPSQGNLFGYIMPLRPKNYKSIVDLMKNRVNPSFYVICRTAFNLTKGYRNLHIAGAKYQDISFGNLFFNPDNGDVLICDNDNVSYGNSKPGGVLGTPGFMAPEIVRGEARPSRDTDRYSLAVLLFYLFMVNHPLEGKQEASIKCMDMAARVKLYGTDPIFIFDPDNKTNRPVPGIHDNANIYWPLYPEQLRQLFIKSFTVGLNNPSKRVTEPEWMNLFANMMSGLMKCTCAVVIDDKMDALIREIQELSTHIIKLEKILDRQQLIDKAKKELLELETVVPMVEKCGSDYNKLYDYVASRAEKEKRKEEIIEQQTALDNQGFSVKNINACREYTSTDSTYLEYKKVGKGTYVDFLQSRLQQIQKELALSEATIEEQKKKIQQNEQAEELFRNEIHTLESQIEALDVDKNRDIEQALETIKTKYELMDEEIFDSWLSIYHSVYDKCELEVERLESENSIAFERQMLKEYKDTIKKSSACRVKTL